MLCIHEEKPGLESYLGQFQIFQLRCSLTSLALDQRWLQCYKGRFNALLDGGLSERVCSACVQHIDSEQHALV